MTNTHSGVELGSPEGLVELRQIDGMGRGVIAKKAIPAGKVLGRAETIEISPADDALIEKSIVYNYVWQHRSKSDWSLLPFGWISFLNHSRTPNCRAVWFEADTGWVIELVTARAIEPGEQLFIDYGCTDEELGFSPV